MDRNISNVHSQTGAHDVGILAWPWALTRLFSLSKTASESHSVRYLSLQIANYN